MAELPTRPPGFLWCHHSVCQSINPDGKIVAAQGKSGDPSRCYERTCNRILNHCQTVFIAHKRNDGCLEITDSIYLLR